MTRRLRSMVLLPALIALASIWISANRCAAQTLRDVDPGRMKISIVTMGPGDEAWEKFGHIAIRLQSPDLSNEWSDVIINWGIFDFAEKGFFLNFLQGRMVYGTDAEFGQPIVESYKQAGRSVFEQELNLTPDQKRDVRDRCLNALEPPDNKYLYDYYRNNCSTRVRDVIDVAVGGELKRQTESILTDTTYRWHTRRLTADDLPLYITLQTLLGHFADRKLRVWDEMFLPTYVRQTLATVSVGQGRKPSPLVLHEVALSAASQWPERAAPPTRLPILLAIGIVVAGLMLGIAHFSARPNAGWFSCIAFTLVNTVWMLIIGVGGVVIVWVLFTDHVAGYYNENMFVVTPIALAQIWWLPRARRGGQSARRALWVAGALLALAVLGIVLKVLPWFYQDNADIIAMTLPPTFAAAMIAWLCTRLEHKAGEAGIPAITGAPAGGRKSSRAAQASKVN